jgi:hypothetical protein
MLIAAGAVWRQKWDPKVPLNAAKLSASVMEEAEVCIRAARVQARSSRLTASLAYFPAQRDLRVAEKYAQKGSMDHATKILAHTLRQLRVSNALLRAKGAAGSDVRAPLAECAEVRGRRATGWADVAVVVAKIRTLCGDLRSAAGAMK